MKDIFGLAHLGYADLPGGQSFGSDVFTKPGCAAGRNTVVHLHAPALGSAVSTGPHVRVRWSTSGTSAASFTVQVRQTSAGGFPARQL